MKRIIYHICLCLSVISCSMAEYDMTLEGDRTGEVVITVGDTGLESKSTEVLDYEQVVRNVQVLAFDSGGKLAMYMNAGTRMSRLHVRLRAGDYEMWGILNGPDCSRVRTLNALVRREVMLGDWNSTNPARGFLMVGHETATVAAGRVSEVTVEVERLVSRVYVGNVTNDLPASFGDIFVQGVFLANVVGNQYVGGGAPPRVWYNRYGSPTGVQGEYADGRYLKAECEDMTWRTVGRTIRRGETADLQANLYSYRNEVTDFPFFPEPFTRSGPVLFLYVRIDDKWYHLDKELPVGLYENKTIRLDLQITGMSTPGDKEIDIRITGCQVTPWQHVSSGNYEI